MAAHGARFHVAEAGSGPLVLLLHSFPQFWWAWRHQLVDLAAAGYRTVAMDLRGYGASDKPPRGYDTPTSAADVAAVIRALGARDAVVVGHGISGRTVWALAGSAADRLRGAVVVGAAHPLTTARILKDRLLRRSPGLVGAPGATVLRQLPLLPERSLVSGDGVADVLRGAGGPGYPSAEELERYTEAVRVPFVAHSALEYHRWIARAALRSDGRRFAASLRAGTSVPVLQLHGSLDPTVSAAAVAAGERFAHGPYRQVEFPGRGHFLPEEEPVGVSAVLREWLEGVRRD
ncbi:alpha/beta fold hydrolase [Kineococcus gynurae]|uniref:Alpha/beta fold hydrolase n=1 Tax=Kineococcus gynurae TaxID=452979 RepID=A0ABV5LU87_9ACTN